MHRLVPASIARAVAVAMLTVLLTGSVPVSFGGARAQSTSGTIRGRVLDQAKNPVPGIQVTIINAGNGNSHSTVTDGDGYYEVAFLPPAFYTVNLVLSGYVPSNVTLPIETRIELNRQNVVIPDIILTQPSATGPTTTTTTTGPTTVTTTTIRTRVSAENTSIVNTSDPARGGNFSDIQIESLPLGGTADMRTFDEYALLVPGVAPAPFTPGIRGPGVGFGIGTAGEFSVNGLRARSNNFTIDGSDNNDPDVGVRRQGFVTLVPQSIESVQEFQISTLLWSSELGRNFGSQVNAVSKDGGNSFHGQVYGFFTDSSLNARNFFDYTGGAAGGENPFTRVQAGIVLGGPIVKNRAQFFGSFEHEDVNTSLEQHFSTPTLGERRFLGLPRFGVLDPFTGAPALTVLDTTLGTTPVGRNLLSFYPLPNYPSGPYGANTFTTIVPADGDGVVASFKVTNRFTDKHTLNARYNFTDDSRVLPSVNRAIKSTVGSESRTQNLSVIFDSALSNRFFNQARFSYGRTRLGFSEYPGNPFIFQSSSTEVIGGVPNPLLSTTGPIGELIVEPFSPVGVDVFTFPQARANNTFQYADSISWRSGRHSIKFGADIRHVQLNSRLDRNYRPLVQFNNGVVIFGHLNQAMTLPGIFELNEGEVPQLVSGVQLASLGQPSSIFQTLTSGPPDSTIGLRFTEYDFFLNDNWQVRPNFTLDYGLRYEYNTVPSEVNGRIERALRLENLPAPGSSRADTPARTAAFNASVEAYRRVLGNREGIYDPDRNNFGPHLGFSWDPWSKGTMSIRGGYGIYYDTILGAVVSQSRNVFPNELPINISPILLPFQALVLNNPSTIQLVTGPNGRPLNPPIPIIGGSNNQVGGNPADLAAILGEFSNQSQQSESALSFTLPAKGLSTPYAQHWHLTLERQLFGGYLVSAAYVGTKGTKLTRLTTPNLGSNVTPFVPVATGATTTGVPRPIPFPPTSPPAIVLTGIGAALTKFFTQQRPIPELGAFQIYENSASSTYHSLQLETRKRFSRGYAFTAAYTWSHAIDDVSDVFPIAGAPILPQDSFNFALEKADANYDVRHRFAASLVWDLPFYRDSLTGAGRALGGWQVATIFQAHTGQPFTLNLPFDQNLDGNLTDRPFSTDKLIFFNGHGRQRVTIAEGAQADDFIQVGQNGYTARNSARADGFINWDLSLNKNFRFTESQNLEFRAEFFNLLNRANFGTPIRVLGNPGFGSAVETVNPARTIQFALKYRF